MEMTYKKRGSARVQRLMRRPTQADGQRNSFPPPPPCVLVVGLSFCPATARPRQMDGPETQTEIG